jgi:soluble lytic murein transglycosylase-like protein
MIRHHGSYSRRGDALRRRNRIKRVALLVGFAAAAAFVAKQRMAQPAAAEATHEEAGMFASRQDLQDELDDTRGRLDLAQAELERAKRVIAFSSRYRIGADLAASILDISLAEGIDPELGFRLVKLESDFNERATSPVGALGLTQVMPSTARYFMKGQVTRDRLYDRDTNLRVGFRYLRTLVGQYKGDVKLALLVYNRGPVAVNAALKQGINPTNGYDRILTKGYKGNGTVD